jgi:SMC interacting uncharacterized protein involved in chromosome segregation
MELTELESRVREASSNAVKYKNKLADYVESFPHMLDEFKKYYIFFNKNPDYNEYGQLFGNIKGNVQQIQSALFTETNNIEAVIEKINKEMVIINDKIKVAKKKNRTLKGKLGIVETTNNGVEEMIDDYKNTYNLQYFTNFTLLLGIIIASYIIFKVYKKPG